MFGSGLESLADVREWSGDPPECPEVSGSGQETLPNVGKWSGCPPRCPGVVGRPAQMFVSGRDALRDVGERPGYPP